MKTGSVHARWLLLGAAATGGLACGPRVEPASGVMARSVAHAEGVRVYADGSGWLGRGAELARVTPVRVRIENDGPWPLRVRYAGAVLVSDAGETFRAVPPFDVHAAHSPALAPRFDHDNVALAPYLGSVYAGLPAEPSPMVFDYHDDVYDHWGKNLRAAPSRFMREVAMPEALVLPRGELSGFLYFEQVPERMQEVTLSLELLHADTGQRIPTICLPVLVD